MSLQNLGCLGVLGCPQVDPTNLEQLVANMEANPGCETVDRHTADEDASHLSTDVDLLNPDPELFSGLLHVKLTNVSRLRLLPASIGWQSFL